MPSSAAEATSASALVPLLTAEAFMRGIGPFEPPVATGKGLPDDCRRSRQSWNYSTRPDDGRPAVDAMIGRSGLVDRAAPGAVRHRLRQAFPPRIAIGSARRATPHRTSSP